MDSPLRKDCATVIHRSRECGLFRNARPLLPLQRPSRKRENPLDSATKDRRSGDETAIVLVVEDDRAVRLLFTRVLESAGYTVIACENGNAGLQAAHRRIDQIRAVVTDATMPGMSGHALITRLRALRPALPAIVVSGAMVDGIGDALTVFLVKPVTPGRLTSELDRLLCGTM